jgi:MinD superfamily P-loop ATPase
VNLLFGPYAKAPKDADVSVTFDIEAEQGSATLRAELVSGKGQLVYESSDVPQLNAEGRRVVTLTHHLSGDVEDLEARLGLIDSSPGTVLTVTRAVLEVHPPGSR